MIHVRLIPIDIRQMDRTYSPPQRFFALLPSSISISYGYVPILTLFYVSRTQSQSLITPTHLHVLPPPTPPFHLHLSTSQPISTHPFQPIPTPTPQTRNYPLTTQNPSYGISSENKKEKRKQAPRVSHSSPPSRSSTDPIERGGATNRVLQAEASLLCTTSSSAV